MNRLIDNIIYFVASDFSYRVVWQHFVCRCRYVDDITIDGVMIATGACKYIISIEISQSAMVIICIKSLKL